MPTQGRGEGRESHAAECLPLRARGISRELGYKMAEIPTGLREPQWFCPSRGAMNCAKK